MKPELKLMLSLEDDTQSKQTEQQSQQEDESKLEKKTNEKWFFWLEIRLNCFK